MNRVVICAAVMAAVILVAVYSLFTVRENSRDISALVEAALAECSDKQKTLSLISEAAERWQNVRPKLDLFAETEKLEEISCLFSRLAAMFENGSDDFAAECLELEERLELLYRSELPRAGLVL